MANLNNTRALMTQYHIFVPVMLICAAEPGMRYSDKGFIGSDFAVGGRLDDFTILGSFEDCEGGHIGLFNLVKNIQI